MGEREGHSYIALIPTSMRVSYLTTSYMYRYRHTATSRSPHRVTLSRILLLGNARTASKNNSLAWQHTLERAMSEVEQHWLLRIHGVATATCAAAVGEITLCHSVQLTQTTRGVSGSRAVHTELEKDMRILHHYCSE